MQGATIEYVEEVPFAEGLPGCRHASTILPLSGGDLLCACFLGSAEGAPDTGIRVARRSRGQWTAALRADGEPGEAHWNPVLARRRDGTVLLFYKVGARIAAWRTMVAASTDGGRSWSRPSELVPGDHGGRGPVRTKILTLSDGAWLAGASLERDLRWTAFIDRSTDEGRSWSRSADLSIDAAGQASTPEAGIPVSEQSLRGRGVIQPTLWEDSEGVHCLLRSTEGVAFRSDSADAGRSWSTPSPTLIPNNNSGLDVLRLPDGRLVLAHNPVGANWGVRTPLVLSVSGDGGRAWERSLVLEEGVGEFSYPAVVSDDGVLLVSWTRNRHAIALARVRI